MGVCGDCRLHFLVAGRKPTRNLRQHGGSRRRFGAVILLHGRTVTSTPTAAPRARILWPDNVCFVPFNRDS